MNLTDLTERLGTTEDGTHADITFTDLTLAARDLIHLVDNELAEDAVSILIGLVESLLDHPADPKIWARFEAETLDAVWVRHMTPDDEVRR